MMIALLTDFGTRDYFVAAMKGVILSINRQATIIDITHEISSQDIAAASFVLQNCYRDFPAKTIFTAVVDPGVGSSRRAIIVETAEYFFIAPDNGLLSFVFENSENYKIYEIGSEIFFRQPVSRTFHGRDVFAPCAAHLSRGVEPAEFGDKVNDPIILRRPKPRRIAEETIEAGVIFVDRFGNLITNLTVGDLPNKFYLEINDQKIEKLCEYFAEAETGELFMIAGSVGLLEIAVFHGSAEKTLNAKTGQKILVKIID